jgi:hypothetical protein
MASTSPTQYERNLTKCKYVPVCCSHMAKMDCKVKIYDLPRRYTMKEFLSFASFLPVAIDYGGIYGKFECCGVVRLENSLYVRGHFYRSPMEEPVERLFSIYKYDAVTHAEDMLKSVFTLPLDILDEVITKFRKEWASRKIQSYVRNVWFEQPTYSNGHVGYHARKTWETIMYIKNTV